MQQEHRLAGLFNTLLAVTLVQLQLSQAGGCYDRIGGNMPYIPFNNNLNHPRTIILHLFSNSALGPSGMTAALLQPCRLSLCGRPAPRAGIETTTQRAAIRFPLNERTWHLQVAGYCRTVLPRQLRQQSKPTTRPRGPGWPDCSHTNAMSISTLRALSIQRNSADVTICYTRTCNPRVGACIISSMLSRASSTPARTAADCGCRKL